VFAPVDLELNGKITRPFGAACKITQCSPPCPDRFLKDVTHGAGKFFIPFQGDASGTAPGIDGGTEKRLVYIDISETGNDSPVH